MAMGVAITAAVVAGGVGGAVLGVPGISGAQTSSSTTVPQNNNAPKPVRHGGEELDAAAKALNLTTEQLRDKLSDGKTTIADVARQQNVDIDTVIDAMVGADRDRIEDMVNKPLPARGDHGPGPGFGHGGRGFIGAGLDAVASALNISEEELKTELRDGKTIKEIAEAHNVDVNTVIDKLVDAANTKLDDAVKNNRLTQEQADKIKGELKTHITEFVNNGFPKMGHGPWGGRPGYSGNTP
jgi:hypothetical protein